MDTPFEYGAHVRLRDIADTARYGIMNGTACGFRVLDAVQAILTGESAGAVLVLVEAENGASVEIPSDRLMPIESSSEGA